MLAMQEPATDTRWTAVLARDASADGQFVFAVATTGIYCRPSCPARRPRPEHVAFFDTPDDAESAGFRACRRCHPRADRTPAEQAVGRARAVLDAAEGSAVPLARLAREAGMSAGHLQRTFTRLVGVSPRAYSAGLRQERLRRSLRKEPTVSRAIYGAGYEAESRAYAESGRALGMTPAAWRKGGAGEVLRVGVAPCALGHVVVAATQRGIAAVRLGGDPRALVQEIREEFPNAEVASADAGLAEWLRQVVALADGMAPRAALPLDLAGTDFQRRVWALLQEVPRGETITYAELARRLGRPTAARAVAGAVAANPVAMVVPCHRVVRSDGGLGGYRWGVERKEELLERERGQDC